MMEWRGQYWASGCIQQGYVKNRSLSIPSMKKLMQPLERLQEQVQQAPVSHFTCNTKWKVLLSFTLRYYESPEKPTPLLSIPSTKGTSSQAYLRPALNLTSAQDLAAAATLLFQFPDFSQGPSHWQTPAQNHARKRILGTIVPSFAAMLSRC